MCGRWGWVTIGKGLAYQCQRTPGYSLVAIADIRLDKAVACAEWRKREYRIVETQAELESTIDSDLLAVCEDGLMAAGAREADVMLEASNAVLGGALHADGAIRAGTHVVMMNFEAELMYGPLLLKRARDAGLVYTCAERRPTYRDQNYCR